MARGKKVLPEGVKVVFEAITGRPQGRGIFGSEDEGDEGTRGRGKRSCNGWRSG